MVGVVADVDHKYFAKPAPAFSIVELPPQNEVSPLIDGVGFGLTIVVFWSVPEHPFASVTVTVNVPAVFTEMV